MTASRDQIPDDGSPYRRCQFGKCQNKVRARGLCIKHYNARRKSLIAETCSSEDQLIVTVLAVVPNDKAS